jgi:hypothetical protein
MAGLGGGFAPRGRHARHSWWDTAGMRAALVVTFCTPSRAARPVAERSGDTPWAHRPARCYERRRPEKTPLHRVVSENLESWLAWREAAERPVPGYVEEELRGYLECGILCLGFARAQCTGCGQAFVVAFSCKGRGVCPSRLSRARQHLLPAPLRLGAQPSCPPPRLRDRRCLRAGCRRRRV